MIETCLYLLIIFSLFGQFSQRYIFTIKGSGFWPQDLFLLFIYLVFFLKICLTKKEYVSPFYKPWLHLVLILIMPIFIGIFRGNFLLTAFRDSRAPFYYLLPLFFISEIDKEEKWIRIVKFIMINSLVCLGIFYFMRLFNLEFQVGGMTALVPLLTEEYSRGYGIYSSWGSFGLVFLILFNLLHLCKISPEKRAMFYLWMFASLWAFISLLIRSFTLSLLFGLLFSIFFILRERKVYFFRFLSIALSFLLIVTLVWTIKGKEMVHNPFVERYLSIFNPEISSPGAERNIEFRKEAIKFGIEKIREEKSTLLFGKGYGDEPLLILEERDSLLIALFNHSSPGWMVYRLGFLISSILFFLFIFLLKRIWSFLVLIKKPLIRSFSYGMFSYIISIPFRSLAGNELFRGDFQTLFFLIIIGLLFSIIQIEKRDFIK